jgi:hypothetical protein
LQGVAGYSVQRPAGRLRRDGSANRACAVYRSCGGRTGAVPAAPGRGEVARKPLTAGELRQLKALFQVFAGSSKGTIVEEVCLSPAASPPVETRHIDLRLDGRWESDRVFKIEANLLGRETREASRRFFWFLLSPEGLRAFSANTDIAFDLDNPGNDVRLLEASSGQLTFFLREEGNVRKTNVLSLRRGGPSGLVIHEHSFVQGVCSGRRSSAMRR